MTEQQMVYRRILRRETHSSRAGAAIVVAVILILLCLAVGAGVVWLAIDPGLRDAMHSWSSGLAGDGFAPPPLLAGGAIVAILGLWLVLLALLPGRRARQGRIAGRVALLADDEVTANAIADRVARRLGVDRGQVRVTVARRAAAVQITPVSGVPVDQQAAARAVDEVADGLGLSLVPRITVADHGVLA